MKRNEMAQLIGAALVAYIIVKSVRQARLASGDANLTNNGNEYAYTLCQDGCHLIRGSDGSGHRTGVTVSVGCPYGGQPVGLWHTHPGGTTHPSAQDIAEMRRLGLGTLCVQVPETRQTDCYRVDSRNVRRL